MTAIEFLNALTNINHSKERRSDFATILINDHKLVEQSLQIAEDIHTVASYKAAWALEFMCKSKLECLLPHLDPFCKLLPKVYQDSALRPIAKICEYLTSSYYRQETTPTQGFLKKIHREQITESCFDWLITDQKVATKAYAMTSLQLLGTEFDWVHPELKNTIQKQYNSQSAAFKARARMVLKKIP